MLLDLNLSHFIELKIDKQIKNFFQVDVAWGRSRHHEDDETSFDSRNDLQELDERADEDVGLQGAVLRQMHQAQRDEVGRRTQWTASHSSDQVRFFVLSYFFHVPSEFLKRNTIFWTEFKYVIGKRRIYLFGREGSQSRY